MTDGPCRCHSESIYITLSRCPKCGHRSLDRAGDWEGCERRRCGHEGLLLPQPSRRFLEGSHPDKCPVEGCDELPEDHRHIGPIEELLEKARLVSQWHGAMNSGPLEVLDAELGELGQVVARVKSNG